MKRVINICTLLVLITLCATSCYNKCDIPAPEKVYTDSDFSDLKKISIYDLKKHYTEALKVGGSELITDDLYISGKVISSDKEGNIYKSLYILDHSGEKSSAIELKLFASNYVYYPVGTMVYVKLKGLTLGDYRSMLSVGEVSSNEAYANNNIESRITLDKHIFLGEQQEMVAKDTLVVTKANYKELTDESLGRLIRFEDVESQWGDILWGQNNITKTFPSYFSSADYNFIWDAENYKWTPTYGHVSADNVKYYGSSWYTYDAQSADIRGQYIARVSSYSRFQSKLIPRSGQHLDITAIYTRFAYDRTDYSSDAKFAESQSSAAYQIVIVRESDIKFR